MIRIAAPEDIEAITAIYNQAIAAGFQTCFTKPFVPAERVRWYRQHSENKYPLLVYEEYGQVVGWLSVSAYREGRAALDGTVEISYFADTGWQGKGIGSTLLRYALAAIRDIGYENVVAVVLDRNTASIKLLEKYGFEKWGNLPGVAVFGSERCGQYYYGLRLKASTM